MTRTQRRFPVQPLLATLQTLHDHQPTRTELLTTAEAHAGVSRRSLQRWEQTGVPCRSADVIGVRVAGHPALIWPDWFTDEQVPA